MDAIEVRAGGLSLLAGAGMVLEFFVLEPVREAARHAEHVKLTWFTPAVPWMAAAGIFFLIVGDKANAVWVAHKSHVAARSLIAALLLAGAALHVWQENELERCGYRSDFFYLVPVIVVCAGVRIFMMILEERGKGESSTLEEMKRNKVEIAGGLCACALYVGFAANQFLSR